MNSVYLPRKNWDRALEVGARALLWRGLCLQNVVGSDLQFLEVAYSWAGQQGGRDTEVAAHRAVLVRLEWDCYCYYYC